MIKGLIIDKDYTNAENTKIIMEDMIENLVMDIDETDEEGLSLTSAAGYDFILNSNAPVKKHVMEERAKPFIKKVIARKADRITIRKHKEVLFVDRNSIVGIEVMGKTCYIYTLDNKYVISRITLGELVKLIGDPCIMRCHKSFALNIKFITGIKKETRNRWMPMFIIDTVFQCIISDMYLEEVVKAFEEHNCINESKYVGF